MHAPAALQSWGAEPPDLDAACAAIGDYSTHACTLVDASEPLPPTPPVASRLRSLVSRLLSTAPSEARALKCSYSGGDSSFDGPRTVDVMYVCGAEFAASRAEEDASSFSAYTIYLEGPSACALEGGGGGGWGTPFLVIFSVALLLYFGGGAVYNYKAGSVNGEK